MITRHHVGLALMCALILTSPIWFTEPVLSLIIVIGTCIGVILPDIQMSRPKHIGPRVPAWIVVRFSRCLVTPLMCRIYGVLGFPGLDPADKRLTHSVSGIFFIFAFVAIPIYGVLYAAGSAVAFPWAVAFLAGLLLGLILHLIEDLCTLKGIFPAYPFRDWRLSGTIRPCNKADPRIGRYHVQHFLVLLFFFGLERMEISAPVGTVTTILSFLGVFVCTQLMIFSSQVTLENQRRTTDSPAPVAAAKNA